MQRSRLHGGNIGQESRIMDTGTGSVLGKVSCVDKLLRDSWNGNRDESIDQPSKTLKRSRGGAGWEFELHDGISIICLIPLDSSDQLNSANNVHLFNQTHTHKEDSSVTVHLRQIMYTLHHC